MNRKPIILFLIIIIPLISYSQNKMSKQEIYNYWNKTSKEIENLDNYKTQFDSVIVKYIDNLKSSGIDTIGAFSMEDVGSETFDTCECGIIPWVAYVQWQQNGKTFHQKITKCCNFKPKEIESSTLINYYNEFMVQIDKEIIMPVITGTSKGEKGEILLNMDMIDHTTHYLIYCELNEHSKFTTFDKYELENEDNIFYADNLNSKINSWRKKIETQINEIRN